MNGGAEIAIGMWSNDVQQEEKLLGGDADADYSADLRGDAR